MTARRPGRSVVTALRVLAAALLAVAVLVAIASIVSLRTARQQLDHRADDLVPAYLDSLERGRTLAETNAAVLAVAAGEGDDAPSGPVDVARRTAGDIATRLAQRLEGTDLVGVGERAQGVIAEWWEQVDVVAAGDADAAALDELHTRYEVAKAANAELTAALKARVDADVADSGRHLDRSVVLVAAVALSAGLVAAVVAWRLARSISRPLQALGDTATAIAAGDAPGRADDGDGPPEVRAVATALNALADERDAGRRTRDLSMAISAVLRGADSESSALSELSALLGRGLGADRCDVFTGAPGEVWELRHGWRRDGLDAEAELDVASLEFATEWVNSADAPIGSQVRAIPDAASPDTFGGDIGQAIARSFRYRAMISSPIRVDDRVVGVLLVRLDDSPRTWTDDDAYVMGQAGEQAAGDIIRRRHLAAGA